MEQNNQKNELLLGLKRWLSKSILYLGDYDLQTFVEDELVFDAICYCIENIEDISRNLITNYKEIVKEKPNIDFSLLCNLRFNIYVNDNINCKYIYDVIKNNFKSIILSL